jgi:hypothetical protein
LLVWVLVTNKTQIGTGSGNWNYSKFFLKNCNLRFFIKVKNHPTLEFASLDEDEKEMRSRS